MDQRTRDMLLAAWRENRLAAVHVDLQTIYHVIEGADEAFSATRNLSSFLRRIFVPNIWVTLSTHQKPEITSVGLYNRRVRYQEETISSKVAAQNSEIAIVKDTNSAFSHPHTQLHRHLAAQKKDTILVGGVYAHLCVMETLKDAVLADRYNVVAVLDAINISPRNISPYADYPSFVQSRCDKPDTFKRNFFSATVPEIMDALHIPPSLPHNDAGINSRLAL